MNLKKLAILIIIIILTVILAISCGTKGMMRGSFREDRGGWAYVHLEGTSREIGYQHGWHLAAEIDDVLKTLSFYLEKETGRAWSFYREAAEKIFWPKLDWPIRMEIEGIAEGLRARQAGLKYDRFDIAALNGWMELAWYYVPGLDAEKSGGVVKPKAPPYCSAFIATGSYTTDGRIIIAHNAWVEYIIGSRWNVLLDIMPDTGHRILMDALPGFVHSGDDFVVNGAGLLYTETTISQFNGFAKDGTPEFARARKAAQYASSIDDFVRIMTTDGNGAYANDWLMGDLKTNEIARLELGLRNHRVWRTTDGYFVGANFPLDEKLITEETTFDPNNAGQSVYIRRDRWNQLMAENKGTIDVEKAMEFLGDHLDASTGARASNGNVLCGHVDNDPKGLPEFAWPPLFPGGSVQGKATSAALAKEMKMWARMGHPCGEDFLAEPFAAAHPEFAWQLPYLQDMKANPWTLFEGKK
ncbi:MAG: C45 family autoproteolytic acyltransferase/hydrolase [Candidatus Aminicenantes bacterium]|nr:C45 family autoproteolytic acyltransferase/hydrolase [Candidatus Aminicenantes bacterium]